MRKIKPINKYDPREIINDILDGKKIYRINFERGNITELKDKAIKTILHDEKNYPNQYGYFELTPDEPDAIEEIENVITDLEKDFIFNPPSTKLRLAAETYGIETQGMTTRQIILEILVKESKGEREK